MTIPSPESPGQSPDPQEESMRQVGEKLMRVQYLDAEEPAVVRERDGIGPEVIGSKAMVDYCVPDAKISWDQFAHGRVAPKYSGQTSGHPRSN